MAFPPFHYENFKGKKVFSCCFIGGAEVTASATRLLSKATAEFPFTVVSVLRGGSHRLVVVIRSLTGSLMFCFRQIIQIAPMPVVQTGVHPNGTAVHPGSPFPVPMATVMAPGATPPQTVLLTSPPTRSLTQLHISSFIFLAYCFSWSEITASCQISIFQWVMMLIGLDVQ